MQCSCGIIANLIPSSWAYQVDVIRNNRPQFHLSSKWHQNLILSDLHSHKLGCLTSEQHVLPDQLFSDSKDNLLRQESSRCAVRLSTSCTDQPALKHDFVRELV